MFKVNNRHQNDINDCVMSSRQGRRFGVFIDNLEHISHLVLVFSVVDFEQANASWGKYLWHKGLIKSVSFTRAFPRICAMRLSVTIHS